MYLSYHSIEPCKSDGPLAHLGPPNCSDCAPQWSLRFSVCSRQDEWASLPASTCSRRTRSVGLGKPAWATAGMRCGSTNVTRPSKLFRLSDSIDDETTFPVAAADGTSAVLSVSEFNIMGSRRIRAILSNSLPASTFSRRVL